MTKPTKAIPEFANGAQGRAYWESHDSTEHLDWSKAQKITLPNLKPTTRTISLRLPQHLLDSPTPLSETLPPTFQSIGRIKHDS